MADGNLWVKQIVQGNLNPVAGIGPKNQGDRLPAAPPHIFGLVQRDKEQPFRVVVPKRLYTKSF